ncbi:putative ripening-related protein 2 [Spatholobus suberectus]|nr:putative ripening-related protein 2 [Spatholobus suberectus]
MYTTYECLPPVSSQTKAYLTLNSFEKGVDGGGPTKCGNQYHFDDTVVTLFTRWFNNKSRGCDADHDYQPPCPNNIVDASRAIWKALRVPLNEWVGFDITWSDDA